MKLLGPQAGSVDPRLALFPRAAGHHGQRGGLWTFPSWNDKSIGMSSYGMHTRKLLRWAWGHLHLSGLLSWAPYDLNIAAPGLGSTGGVSLLGLCVRL